MKSNIFNVLGWFEKKERKPVKIERPLCNCKNLEEVRAHRAVTIGGPEALEKYLKSANIEFSEAATEYNYIGEKISTCKYNVAVDNIKIIMAIDESVMFYKYAYLSCKTCLGWSCSFSRNYEEVKIKNPN